MSIITDVIESTKAIIQGMGVTLSYIPKRKWTVEYRIDYPADTDAGGAIADFMRNLTWTIPAEK